jgi:hypothetical protein
MEKDIAKLIAENTEHIKTAFLISDSINKIKLEILSNLKEQIIQYVEKSNDFNLKVYFSKIDLGKKDSCFWFAKEHWKYGIYFYFDCVDFEQLYLGILAIDSNNRNEIINQKFKEMTNNKLFGKPLNNSRWIWIVKFEEWNKLKWFEAPIKAKSLFIESVKKILIEIDENMFLSE